MSYGRRKIFTDAREITLENVVEEVRKAVLVHDSNRNEINKLYDYYRGKTPILGKQKETRPEINHKEMLKIVLRILMGLLLSANPHSRIDFWKRSKPLLQLFRQKKKGFRAFLLEILFLEVTPRFELGNEGFADPCLTTWLCHRIEFCHYVQKQRTL